MGIGKRIKEAREALHLTQKELADKIGITASSITNYENETSHPKEPILYKLINELQVDANFLFQDSVATKKSSAEAEDDFRLNKIVEIYSGMNEAGQDSLYDQAIMHSKNEKFKKYNSVTETA